MKKIKTKILLLITLSSLSVLFLILGFFTHKKRKIVKVDNDNQCTDTNTTGKKGDECKIFGNDGCLIGKWSDDISKGGTCDTKIDNTLSQFFFVSGVALFLALVILYFVL